MNPSSRRLVRAMSCVVALAAALPIDGLRAQPGFPDKPVHLVVPRPPAARWTPPRATWPTSSPSGWGSRSSSRIARRRQLAGRAAGCTLGARWVHAALRVLGILDAAGALSAIAVCAERPHCGGSGRLGALCVRGPAGRAVSHHEGVHRLREEPAEAVEHRLRSNATGGHLLGVCSSRRRGSRSNTFPTKASRPRCRRCSAGSCPCMPVTVSLGTRADQGRQAARTGGLGSQAFNPVARCSDADRSRDTGAKRRVVPACLHQRRREGSAREAERRGQQGLGRTGPAREVQSAA